MLCTEIVSDIQNNFCTQHVLQKEGLLPQSKYPVLHYTVRCLEVVNTVSEYFRVSKPNLFYKIRPQISSGPVV